MAKRKAQPKAGNLALRPSPPFAKEPRLIYATTPVYTKPDHGFGKSSVIPADFDLAKIKHCPAMPAGGSNIWKNKGQMSGGITSRIPVARAYIGSRG